jgi:ABC-type Fe3+ transport system permease subunit
MENPYILGLISWFVPGAGHFIQRRWRRGIAIAAAVWLMFVIGLISGGAYYPGFPFKDGALLSLLNIFARFGNGLGALISYAVASVPDPNVAARATFEYGGRFIEIAGLLNYLAALDAFDIGLGRKK